VLGCGSFFLRNEKPPVNPATSEIPNKAMSRPFTGNPSLELVSPLNITFLTGKAAIFPLDFGEN
jgi:hypothetical protein